MNNFLNLIIKGIFVGIANIIPGVSGGTIAVVLRIFDQLIDAINNFFKEPKKHIKFLLPLSIGSVIGILIFSKILQISLEKESFPTNMFFVGLVIGSIPLIYSEAKKKDIKPIYYLASLISFFVVVLISYIQTDSSSVSTNNSIFWYIQVFLFSIIASSAMVIPGISGSFVLVLLGLYNNILSAISNIINVILEGLKIITTDGFLAGIMYIISSDDFIILCVAGAGMVIGVILISKIIAILLEKAFSLTYFSVLGLIFGSIFSIFKDDATYSSYDGSLPLFSIILAIILGIVGFFIAIILSKNEKK